MVDQRIWGGAGSVPRNRGAIYARYSTDMQHSIEDQVRSCHEWAESHEVVVLSEHIFTDAAVTGRSRRRPGLLALEEALASNQVDVVITFASNRLHRKAYLANKFIEEEVIDRSKRCVMVSQGVDTAEKDQWRLLSQVHGIMDEAALRMTRDQVRAAHEGLLMKGWVYGTISYGYTGQPIEGRKTRTGRAACRLVIRPDTAAWVNKAFNWFAHDEMTMRQIARRLNEERAPLPPRCQTNQWTAIAIRRMLTNERYCGVWCYGNTEAIWQNRQSYSRQVKREEPRRRVEREDLRIIDDVLWHAAQDRIASGQSRGGRRPGDGGARVRVLNGMIYCSVHNRTLHVGGAHGTAMFCPDCKRVAEPHIYSMLPIGDATKLVCGTLAKLLWGDKDLVEKVVTGVRRRVEEQQIQDRPDHTQSLRRLESLQARIDFILSEPGDTAADQEENRKALREARAERAKLQQEAAETQAVSNKVQVPTEAEARKLITGAADILLHASASDSAAEVAAVRKVVEALTRGRMVVTQQGERKARRGWLRLTFTFDALQLQPAAAGSGDAQEVSIDIKVPTKAEQLADRIKGLLDTGSTCRMIAADLGVRRNMVKAALAHWHISRGLSVPDFRQHHA